MLLQLSSITSGWLGVGAIANQPLELSAGEMAFFAALAGGVAYANAQADPHWQELRAPGHFDGAIDDDCARLANLTAEERADLDALPDERKEFARRMITSKSWKAIVSRLKHQAERRASVA